MFCPNCHKENQNNTNKCVFCGGELSNNGVSVNQNDKKVNRGVIYKLAFWLSILQVVIYIIFLILIKFDNYDITHIMLYVLPVIWLAAIIMSIISYIKYKNISSLLLCLADVFLAVFYICAVEIWRIEVSQLLVEDAINRSAEIMAGCKG